MYNHNLNNILNEYNNTYHRTIKIKPVDVKDGTYIDSMELHSNKEVNDTDPKFKFGDHVRISKHKSIFPKNYTPNWSDEVFVIKKVKNIVLWAYVINYLNGDKIIETFYEKELQKTNQQECSIEKVINYMSNGKVMIVRLITGLIKKT